MSSFSDYYFKNIGMQVRKYRLAANLTQEELSAMLGKNEKYIGHIERCERIMSKKIETQFLEVLKI